MRRMTAATRRFTPEFGAALERRDVDAAIAVSGEHPDSHVARVLGVVLRAARPLLGDERRRERAVASAERTIAREQILLATELRTGLGGIATVGATAPFVGLLGTVIGITNSFTGLAEAGGGGIEAVAGGIGETLVTTALGLLVAIPSIWVYNAFMTRLERLFAELAYAGQELVDWIDREGAATPMPARPAGPPAPAAVPASARELARAG
jgi:biopolymer transport protein ExbB/biopolymer transport protein TolQ